jgi:hypothetical protein
MLRAIARGALDKISAWRERSASSLPLRGWSLGNVDPWLSLLNSHIAFIAL